MMFRDPFGRGPRCVASASISGTSSTEGRRACLKDVTVDLTGAFCFLHGAGGVVEMEALRFVGLDDMVEGRRMVRLQKG